MIGRVDMMLYNVVIRLNSVLSIQGLALSHGYIIERWGAFVLWLLCCLFSAVEDHFAQLCFYWTQVHGNTQLQYNQILFSYQEIENPALNCPHFQFLLIIMGPQKRGTKNSFFWFQWCHLCLKIIKGQCHFQRIYNGQPPLKLGRN